MLELKKFHDKSFRIILSQLASALQVTNIIMRSVYHFVSCPDPLSAHKKRHRGSMNETISYHSVCTVGVYPQEFN